MTLSHSTIRRHHIGASLAGLVLAALVLAGLAVAPAAAQTRCAVSAQRGRQLVWRYRQYGAEKVRVARRYNALKNWCRNNWRLSHTPRYRNYRGQMQNLKVRYNWVRHHMNQIQAEYHGRSGGYVAAGGMNTSRPTTSGGLLGQRLTSPVRSPVRTTRTSSTNRSSTTSQGPNFGGLNLLNQRVQNPVRGR